MKKIAIPAILGTITVSIFSCSGQQASTKTGFDLFINSKVDSIYKAEKVPGIFIGISNNGVRKYYNFGYADPDKKLLFDSATIFEIGSLTKTFTAYILEKILMEKSINENSPILPYLPDSVQQNKVLQEISFFSLLNHTSGLPRLPDNMDLASKQPYENYDNKKLFSYLKHCQPRMDRQYEYSNLGFGLAGVLATIIANKPYSTLVNENIFYPMAIRKSGESLNAVRESRGYFEQEPVAYWKFDAIAGAGSLACSANEMLTYFQKLSSPVNEESKMISRRLLEPTFTIAAGRRVCRAWHTIEEKGKPVIYWHNGGTYGFSSFGAFVKEKNMAVIVVVNQFNRNSISDGIGVDIIKMMMQ